MSEKKEESDKKDKTNDIDDHISKRYEMKKRLGKGMNWRRLKAGFRHRGRWGACLQWGSRQAKASRHAYGIVWKAVDKKSKEVVAVKKIFDAFRNQTDAQRTFREIMFLQAFKDHPNIIRLRGLHKASNNRDIYLVFDYMDTDLHHVIKKGNVLKDIHRRYIMYQLLRATRYLHSGDVIHRDQKPSNILINAECRIKLADFGLARSLATYYAEEETEGPPLLTDYVATRWYRAPEILVASKRYTKGVDMWSLGCILGEMLLGKPLFPGSSTVNQIERIMAALPKPSPQEINNMCSGYGKGLLEGATGPKTNLRDIIKSNSEEAVDLVTKLLVFDPTKRLTASQALAHPYVSKFCNGSEVCLDHSIVPPLNDDIQLSVAEYRNKLYELIANGRHPSKSQSVAPKLIKNKSSPLDHSKKSLENVQRKLSKYINGDALKENLHKSAVAKYRSQKNHSVEELRDKTVPTNPVIATKSEPSQKTGTIPLRHRLPTARTQPRSREETTSSPPDQCSLTCSTFFSNHSEPDCSIKKSTSSPQHRSHVPPTQTRTEWSEWPKSVVASQSKTCYIRQRFDKHTTKSAECGDGCNVVKSSQNFLSGGLTHLSHYSPNRVRGVSSNHQEKVRQVPHKLANFPALTKVQPKKDYLRHSSDTSSVSSSYNQAHGILTSSQLHDIRAVLKH